MCKNSKHFSLSCVFMNLPGWLWFLEEKEQLKRSTQKINPSSYIFFSLPVFAMFVDSVPLSTNSLLAHQLLPSLNFPLHIQIRVQHWIYQTWAKICLMITLRYLFGLFLSILSPLLFLPSLFLLNLVGSICPWITSFY